ncbi:MAG: hypothetical protein EOO20_02830 [Chryseobacterium sp.]|nr:MAG: hypothetical protein EOO20_02830 [Chryseobacterium sp.]
MKKIEKSQRLSEKSEIQITSLPLSEVDRVEFIKSANNAFEKIIERMEPRNVMQTRKLRDAQSYVDNLLGESMLPISRDYALSLTGAFLVGHVASLAAKADEMVM